MKYLLKGSLVLMLVAFVAQAQAQLKYGVKAGLNINNIAQNYAESDFETETKARLGFHIGATVDYNLSDILSLQSGLLLSSKGYSIDIEEEYGDGAEGYERIILNYLEIPINFAYKTGDFQIFAGPYLAFGIGGKYKYDDGTDSGDSKMKPVFGEIGEGDLEDDENPYSALDLGFNLGVGYQVGPMLINAGYSLGFANLNPGIEGADFDPKDFKQSNRVISLSVSYFLE